MNWIEVAVIVAILAALYFMRRGANQVGRESAVAHLKAGALLIDVRSPGEFASGHLPKAINIPLDGIETALPRRVPNKDEALLLYCQSGTRSGLARRRLKGLGYGNALNVGSYARAARICEESGELVNR